MATYTKVKLSAAGSHNRPIWLGNIQPFEWMTIHQTGTSSTTLDELWLWASQTDGSNGVIKFRLHDGNTGEQFSQISVPSYSTVLVVPGLPISGDGTLAEILQVYGLSNYASTYVYGYVNRITP